MKSVKNEKNSVDPTSSNKILLRFNIPLKIDVSGAFFLLFKVDVFMPMNADICRRLKEFPETYRQRQ